MLVDMNNNNNNTDEPSRIEDLEEDNEEGGV